MKAKLILPTLTEAESPYFRPIKYSLFPPIGLATLAAHFDEDDDVTLIDQHIEPLYLDDEPDLVCIQVYITNAYRAYRIADHYRAKGVYVAMGGLHVTALPKEAALHADTILLGPGEETFPAFLHDFRLKATKPIYRFTDYTQTLHHIKPVRRNLIKRDRYLVPNSLVVSRGCPHHCDFCYKDAFYNGGKSFYTQLVDEALEEIERLPGRHLYFLDDHLLGAPHFAESLFEGMRGMNRIFQSAATVESVLKGNLIEKAAEAGLRSLFLGFETFSAENLIMSNKNQNLQKDYSAAVRRLHELGIMINGSFVFGLDADDADVFHRTVDWGIENAITTATYHILTPYPSTRQFQSLEAEGRIVSRDWDIYDTRHVVYHPKRLTSDQIEAGYWWAYDEFYRWRNIWKASMSHDALSHKLKHLFYTAGWKKFEPFWDFMVRTGDLQRMLPALEKVLSKVR